MTMTLPITHRRHEATYAVPLEQVAAVEAALPSVAAPVEYVKGRAETLVTAVYLDRPDLSLSRTALLSPAAQEEIRSTEFYVHEESLVPTIWVEWEARRDAWRDERRFALSKEAFSSLCAGTLREDEVRQAQPVGGEQAGVEAFRRVMACARGVLVPRFAATWARRTFSIHAPRIRVTFDTRIRFCAVPRDPYLGAGALSPRRLGGAFHEMPHALLEVRAGSELPAGLKDLLRGLFRCGASRFAAGARHLLA